MISKIQLKNANVSSAFSVFLILIIGWIDYVSGPELALSVFYLIPVLLISLQYKIRYSNIVIIAFLASITWFVAEFLAQDYSNVFFPVWNASVRLLIFLLVGQLAFSLNQKHQRLKETNQKLSEMNAEKNRLIGMAAHDLRNPIGNIFAFSDLLISGYAEKADPNAVKIYHYIKDISSHTLEILEKLLDISVIESGTLSLSVKEQDYLQFIEKYIALNQMIANKKQIKIKLISEQKQILLPFDNNYMSEVINNLLTNAIKFSFPNSEIKVKVAARKQYVKTEISDVGKGIPFDEQEKLFKYFQTTSVKPTAGEKSTGLGLAIAKKIITGHNGQIGVTSEPGKGSTFYFDLPKRK